MECNKCGHEIVEGAAFCPYCGEKVAAEAAGEEKPVYLAEVKGLLKSGRLAVYRDRVEFIASSVQKTIFNYSALVSVKKGLDRIVFVTEDGRTESCPVNRKNIHEAFLYIDKASRPYIEERNRQLLSKGVQYSLVSSQGLTGGILNILADRAEFRAKSGQSEAVLFQDVKSVCLSSMGMLEFSLFDGRKKSFSLDKEIRDEVLAYVANALAPYLAERKQALLARGIYYSCLSRRGAGSGTLDVLADRVEFTSPSGPGETVLFRDVRAVSRSAGSLELLLTDGSSKSFTVDSDIWSEVISFVGNAIEPFVTARTAGFETAFGIDERIEINEQRGVFHIIRQGGSEITDEFPLADVARCEQVCSASNNVLDGVLSGGMAVLNTAARAAGAQGVSAAGDKVGCVGVLLTVRGERGEQRETVRFGDFPLGMNRASPKYDRYIAEVARFMEYLERSCPACEQVIPAPPACEDGPGEPAAGAPALETAADAAGGGTAQAALSAAEKDQFGIIKYIEGVSGFIGECATPMTIAIQGSWGSGKNGIMNMLSASLEDSCKGNLIWFHTWQYSQPEADQPLAMLVGRGLIGQLSGTPGAAAKDRAIKVAKGLINITSSIISQGSSDGQSLMDALFRDNALDSLEKVSKAFSDLVRKRAGGESGKVVIFIDDLDRLAPAKRVELLEAMRSFFDCEGCVFVIAVDYNSIIRGAMERYGQDFDENRGKSFFNKLFQVSFRVPVSGYNIRRYVQDKLEQIEICTGDEAELDFYVELIERSVGCEPKSMERLFNSFLLLKKLADEETYASRYKRLMLFALLCMQTKFRDIYDFMVRIKDKVTPDFLLGLCSEQSEAVSSSSLSGDERTAFRDFARVFCDIINTDREREISESECREFAEVLDFSSITSQ